MKIFIPFLFIMLIGCTKTVYLPAQTTIQTVYRDTTIVIKDTVKIYLPSEEKAVKTTADSSHLETNYSKSDAWIDEDGQLNHTLKNKTDVPVVDKQDTTLTIPMVEKVVEKEVPVKVEVPKPYIPKWCWFCVFFTIGVIGYTVIKIWLKLKIR